MLEPTLFYNQAGVRVADDDFDTSDLASSASETTSTESFDISDSDH